MSKLRERIPFNVGDEVVFSMANGRMARGIVECSCYDWVRFKDGDEIRLDWVWKLRVIKRADVAKEAEEFLKRECPKDEKKKEN